MRTEDMKEQMVRSKETARICRCKKPVVIDSNSFSESNCWFNPFSVLKLETEKLVGFSEKERIEEITKNYRKIAILIHPDKNSHPDADDSFSILVESYNMLLDLKTMKRIIMVEVNTRTEVENTYKKEIEKSRKKSNRNEIVKESIIEEKVEKEIIKLFFEYQKEKKKKEEKGLNEDVIILGGPILEEETKTSFNDIEKEALNETIISSSDEEILSDRSIENTIENQMPTFNLINSIEENENLDFNDIVESNDGEISSTALALQSNLNEIVSYSTSDSVLNIQPNIVNNIAQRGAEHVKNKMPHKKDRHELGIAQRNRQKNSAEKRLKKTGFAFTGKVRFASNNEEQMNL